MQCVVKAVQSGAMGDPAEAYLNELRAWCQAKYGRQAEAAWQLGVSKAKLNDWVTGRTQPSFSEGLKLIEFLKKVRKGVL